MIIQQNTDVALWGTAPSSSLVKVIPSWGNTSITTSDANGHWNTTIETGAADNNTESVTIACGTDTLSITDVLIGEVWLASGQSNMVRTLAGDDSSSQAIAISDNNYLRLFDVGRNSTLTPQQDVTGSWIASSTSTSGSFSAVAYYFANKLQEKLGLPVGIIESAFGGTPVESWMDEQTLVSLGVTIPTQLQDPKPHKTPTSCYNGMIHPLVGYNFGGAIWYQGESNRTNHNEYQERFTAMISSWRTLWGISSLPFCFVQIAPYDYGSPANNLQIAGLRQAQLNIMRTVNNTGMVVTLDVGDCSDIHPTNKKPVGNRLANWALANHYGYGAQAYPFRGPEVDTIVRSGLNLTLYFNHAHSLNAGGGALSNFEVSANGSTYTSATATIQSGDTSVLVTSASTTPNYVRYAASGCVSATLFNEQGLPASPFTISAGSNNEPAFTNDTINAPSATEGLAYSHSLSGSARDADSDSLIYMKVLGPAWLNVASDGTMSGMPDAGDVGLNQFRIKVSDDNGGSGEATLNITVDAGTTVKTYVLTVNNGSGGGSYPESTQVSITANAPTSGNVFDQWTGDVANVVSVFDDTTTITMPDTAVELTATYSDITSIDIDWTTSEASDVRIYPNPANSTVYIETTVASEVKVYNVAGQMIYNKQEAATSHNIGVSKWESGVYLMKVRCGGRIYNKKLIVA